MFIPQEFSLMTKVYTSSITEYGMFNEISSFRMSNCLSKSSLPFEIGTQKPNLLSTDLINCRFLNYFSTE